MAKKRSTKRQAPQTKQTTELWEDEGDVVPSATEQLNALQDEQDEWLDEALQRHRKEGSAPQAPGKTAKKKPLVVKHPSHYGARMDLLSDQERDDVKAVRRRMGAAALAQQRMLQKEFGHISAAGLKTGDRMIMGVPMPFPMQCLLRCNIFPLGRVIQLLGKEKSCKSSLTFEITRWFAAHAGGGKLVENESKYSPRYAMSVIDPYREVEEELLAHVQTELVEESQDALVAFLKSEQQWMDRPQGNSRTAMGRVYPVLFILDSLTGKMGSEAWKQIDKEGHASRGYAIEAQLNKKLLQFFSGSILEYPFSLIIVNHMTRQQTDKGAWEKKVAGGKFINFQKSLELEMRRKQVWSGVQPSLPGAVGQRMHTVLDIRCHENSLAPHTKDPLTINYWVEEVYQPDNPYWAERGGKFQVSRFDWGGATVDLLTGLKEKYRQDAVAEVVDINPGGADKYWSKTLGVDKKSPLPKSEFGDLIGATPEVVAGLQRVFNIQVYRVFRFGRDFLEQLTQIKHELAKKLDDF